MLTCSDMSPTDAEAENVFSREAVGRQSMSEKRKAYMDARLLNFYQQAKTVRGIKLVLLMLGRSVAKHRCWVVPSRNQTLTVK